MIIVFGTDVTLFVIFLLGFLLGRMRKQNLNLKRENLSLKKAPQTSGKPRVERTP